MTPVPCPLSAACPLSKAPWPAGTFANIGGRDHGNGWAERNAIYDLVRDAKITGFAIVAGDRHSLWAGDASARLPPGKFEPVRLSFVGAGVSSPGAMEGHEHRIPKDLRAPDSQGSAVTAAVPRRPPGRRYAVRVRLDVQRVRSCLEYAKTFDRERARAVSNPALSPHLEFIDMGGHGYATVRLSSDDMRTEFVCIPRPITRSERPDGGPLRYRVVHRAKLWRAGERPQLTRHVVEGDPGLGI